jgi:hypothetical protein
MKTNPAKYQRLRNAGTFSGTIKRAVTLRDARDKLAAKTDPLTIPLAKRYDRQKAVVPFGATAPVAARNVLAGYQRRNPRLREWSLGCVAGTDTRLREIGSNSDWRKRSTFQRGVVVQSVAVACGRCLFFTLSGEKKRIAAPFGYRWERDKNGVKLVSRSHPDRDYHPTAGDLLGNVRDIVAKLKANYETRRLANANKKQQLAAVRRAEREGATVCLRDSIRAGNCIAGTSNFCQRHGLDSRRHYKPSEVLAVANGDASRVALVVTVALKRHREEMRRGYAILAEHQA